MKAKLCILVFIAVIVLSSAASAQLTAPSHDVKKMPGDYKPGPSSGSAPPSRGLGGGGAVASDVEGFPIPPSNGSNATGSASVEASAAAIPAMPDSSTKALQGSPTSIPQNIVAEQAVPAKLASEAEIPQQREPQTRQEDKPSQVKPQGVFSRIARFFKGFFR